MKREWRIREAAKPSVNMILECDDKVIMIILKSDKKGLELAEFISTACEHYEELLSVREHFDNKEW